jgi:transcriptional/translational regulatory protein YebC/TACO1
MKRSAMAKHLLGLVDIVMAVKEGGPNPDANSD